MKNKYLTAVLVVSMLLITACGGQSAKSIQPAKSNNDMAESTPTPKAEAKKAPAQVMLDPALTVNASGKEAISKVFEGLVRLENGKLVVVLAIDLTPSADNLDYVVTLRPGVAFHDGTKLDADAVVTNFNRWFDPKDPLHGSGTYSAWVSNFGGFKGETDSAGKPQSEFDGIEKQNETTVILHLNQPDQDLLTKLSDPAFSIVSPAALKAAGFGTPQGQDGGTGPYKIGKWSSSGLSLDPFSSYWEPSVVPANGINITFDL
jgi:peptide/nickel transport system substrate-binding protein